MANAMIFGHLLEDLNDGVTVFREGAGKPMPLASTDIDIEITSGLAVVVTTRKFSNAEDVPIEAILTMPVGFNAVVTGLSAKIDGRKLRAIAKAKEAARDDYEAAIDEGKMAILHEEALRGIHVLSVGQLAPGKEVEVELRMVMPLALSEGGPFLRLPMTAGQLYGSSPLQPADDLVTDGLVRHEANVTIRTDAGVPDLLGYGPITADGSVKITLDRAVEIVVQGGRFGTVTGVSADGHQVRIDLRPQATTERNLKLAILVDRSGSTSSAVGNGTETVLSAMRNGLADAMSGITDDDHVALWQFSDECQRLGTGSGTEILQILKKLNQPGGGTRLGAAIRKVAASGMQDILVLTDGQTWETLPELAAELNIRVSAVLVGKASLDANIGHLCALTGGDIFYVPDAEVGQSVCLAVNSKRSAIVRREFEQTEGRPTIVKHGFGGVEIAASWSDAMEVGSGTDFGRFAAWLCLGRMDADEAETLALKEGLCTDATSLVLVDDVGEVSEGISETRKIPLMAAADQYKLGPIDDSGPSVRFCLRQTPSPMQLSTSAAPRFGISMLDAKPLGIDSREPDAPMTPEQIAAARESAAVKRTIAKIWPSRGILAWLNDDLTQPGGDAKERKQTEAYLRSVAEGIDWGGQVNQFLALDFSGLLREEDLVLEVLGGEEPIKAVLADLDLHPKLALLAYLAARFVDHSRAAHRFSKRVLAKVSDRDLVAELETHVFSPNKKKGS